MDILKKAKIFPILCVFCLLILVQGCGKSDEVLIKERINTFAEVYSAGDMEAVLDCMDKKTRTTYKSAMKMSNALLGKTGLNFGLSEIWGVTVGVMSDDDILQISDVKIDSIQDDTAEATVTLSFNSKEKVLNDSQIAHIELVKEGGDWFVKDIN